MSSKPLLRILSVTLYGLSISAIAATNESGTYVLLRADAGVSILRSTGKNEPAEVNRTLAATDQLCFSKPKAKVSLKQKDGSAVIEHTEPETGCRAIRGIVARSDVSSEKISLSTFKQVWAALTVDRQRDGNAVVGAARGSNCANVDTDYPVQFDMPILRAKKSYLTEGERSLFLTWRGGKAPFRVALDRVSDGTRLLDQTSGLRCETNLPTVSLKSGHYRLTVTDANGNAYVEDNLEVVPIRQRPAPPNLSTWLDQVQWLAEQQEGVWRLEAIQDLEYKLTESTK